MGEDLFVQKTDMFGRKGINPRVKLVACLWCIACGDACDREDENLMIAQSTLKPFSFVVSFQVFSCVLSFALAAPPPSSSLESDV